MPLAMPNSTNPEGKLLGKILAAWQLEKKAHFLGADFQNVPLSS